MNKESIHSTSGKYSEKLRHKVNSSSAFIIENPQRSQKSKKVKNPATPHYDYDMVELFDNRAHARLTSDNAAADFLNEMASMHKGTKKYKDSATAQVTASVECDMVELFDYRSSAKVVLLPKSFNESLNDESGDVLEPLSSPPTKLSGRYETSILMQDIDLRFTSDSSSIPGTSVMYDESAEANDDQDGESSESRIHISSISQPANIDENAYSLPLWQANEDRAEELASRPPTVDSPLDQTPLNTPAISDGTELCSVEDVHAERIALIEIPANEPELSVKPCSHGFGGDGDADTAVDDSCIMSQKLVTVSAKGSRADAFRKNTVVLLNIQKMLSRQDTSEGIDLDLDNLFSELDQAIFD